jgi:hypothetical protein
MYTGRNTGMFYALISRLPGYSKEYKEVIKEGVINDFFTERFGTGHRRPLSLSKLSDMEYNELIGSLRIRVEQSATVGQLQDEQVRKAFIHRILKALTRIGVYVENGDYSAVNYHIGRLPIAKGRMIPKIKTEELPRLEKAVYDYCDNIRKKQAIIKRSMANN